MNFGQNLTYCSGYPAYVITPTDISQAYGGVRRKEIVDEKLRRGSTISWYGATKHFDQNPDEVQHEFSVFSVDSSCTEDQGRITSIHTIHEGSACYLKELKGQQDQISDSLNKRSQQWDAVENLGQIYLSWDISDKNDIIQEIYICGYTTGVSGRIHSVEIYLLSGRLLKICGDMFNPYNSRVRVFPPQQLTVVEPRVLVGIECITCMEERRFYGGISMIKFGLAKLSDIVHASLQDTGIGEFYPNMSDSRSQSPGNTASTNRVYQSEAISSVSSFQNDPVGELVYSHQTQRVSIEYPVITPQLTVLRAQPIADGNRVLLLVTQNLVSELLIVIWDCVQNKAQNFLLIPHVKQDDNLQDAVLDYQNETVLFFYKQDILIWKLDTGKVGQLQSSIFRCKSEDLRFLHAGDWTFGLMLGIWHFFFDLTVAGECKWHLDSTLQGSQNEAKIQNFEEIADTYMTRKRLQKFDNKRLYSSFKDIFQNSKCIYPSNDSMYTCLITKSVEPDQARYAHICISAADEQIHTLHLCQCHWQAAFSPDTAYIVLWCCAKRIIRIVNLHLMSDEYLELPNYLDVQYICITMSSIVVCCLQKIYLVSLECAGITHELDPFDFSDFECSVQTVPRVEESRQKEGVELKHIVVWNPSCSGKNVYMWMLHNCMRTVKQPFLIRHIPFQSQRDIRGGQLLFLPTNQFATVECLQNHAYNVTRWKMQQKEQYSTEITMLQEMRKNQICNCKIYIQDDLNLKVQQFNQGVECDEQCFQLPYGDEQEVQSFQAQTEVQGANIVVQLWIVTRWTQNDGNSPQNNNDNSGFTKNSDDEKASLIANSNSESFLEQFQTLENLTDFVYWYKIVVCGWNQSKPTVQKMCDGYLPQFSKESQQRYVSAHGHNICASCTNSIDSLLINVFYEQKQLHLNFNHNANLNFKLSEMVQQISVKISQNSTEDTLDCTVAVYIGSTVQLWHIKINKNSYEFQQIKNSYVIAPGYAYGINMETAFIDIGTQFLEFGVVKQSYLVDMSDCCSHVIIFSEIQAHDQSDDQLYDKVQKQYVHCLTYQKGALQIFAKQDVSMDERPIMNFQVKARIGLDGWQIMISALQGYWKVLRGSIIDDEKASSILQIDVETKFTQYNVLHLLSSKFIGCYNQTGEYVLYELTQNQVMEKRLEFDIGQQGHNFFHKQQGAHFTADFSADNKQLQFQLLGNQKLAVLVLQAQHDNRNIDSLPVFFQQQQQISHKNLQIENLKVSNLEKSLIWLEKQQIPYVQAVTQETVDKKNLLLQVLGNCNALILTKIVQNLEDICWLAVLPLFSHQEHDQLLGNNIARDEAFHGETFKIFLEWMFHKEEESSTETFIWNIAPKSIAKVIPLIWCRLVNSYPQLAFQVVCDAQFMPSLKQLNPYSFHRLAVVKGSTQMGISNSIAPIPTTLWKQTPTGSIELQSASACVILFQGACRNDIKGLLQPLLYSDQGYERAYDLPPVRSVIQQQSEKYGKFLLLPEALMYLALLLSFHCFAVGITFLEEFPSTWARVDDCGTFFVVTVIYGFGNIALIVCAIYCRYFSKGSIQLTNESRGGGVWNFTKISIMLILGYLALALQIVYLVILEPWVALVQCGILIVRYAFMEYIQISKKGLWVYYNNPWNYLDALSIVMFFCICAFYLAGWHKEVLDEEWVLRRTFISLVVLEQMALTFKILGFLKGFKTFGPTIQMIFEVFKDSKFFIILLGIIMSTFAVIFVVLFGSEIRHFDAIKALYTSNPIEYQHLKSLANEGDKFEVDYRSAFHSFLGTLSLAIANVNLSEITTSVFHFVAGPLFVLYILLVHIVLFNLLVAILSSVYEKIRADEQARFLGGQAAIMDDLLACSSFTQTSDQYQYLHILHQNKDHLGGSVHDEWMGVTDWMHRQLSTMKRELRRQMTHQHSRSQQMLHSHSNNLESVFSQEVTSMRTEFQEQLQQYDQGISQKIKQSIQEELHDFLKEFDKRGSSFRSRKTQSSSLQQDL